MLTATRLSSCRICGSERITKVDEVEFFFGYAWPIYDCDECGCRFTRHDDAAYDLLYSEHSSCYSRYSHQAEACKRLFESGDRMSLRAELSQGSKYRFIINEIEHEPADTRILEIGCSRGHLTSYFILTGRKITGVDVSPRAIAAAKSVFGDYFLRAGDPIIGRQAPYDVIFHVGTIGCVADPIGMTKVLLGLLKPGGRLLFNAPNRDGCSLKGQLWFESAPPPDVVTMFPSGFWRSRFSDVAIVHENIECRPPDQNSVVFLRRVMRRRWRKPVPIRLQDSERWSAPIPTFWDPLWKNLERVVRKIGFWTGLDHRIPSYPSEYGLFVQMVKR